MKFSNQEFDVVYTPEPKLTFGYDQKAVDPRDGLTWFGPSSQRRKGPVSVGIVGSENEREFIKIYLEKIHRPVYSTKSDIARPFFPGIEAAFNIHVDLESIVEVDIDIKEVDKNLAYTDGFIRIYNLTELYSKAIIKYLNRGHNKVDIWFIAIPRRVYLHGRPNSKGDYSEQKLAPSLSTTKLKSNQLNLFHSDEQIKYQQAAKFEKNFHNQLKAKLLNHRIPTQIIIDDTVGYETLLYYGVDPTNEKKVKWVESKVTAKRVLESQKAWNICTTMYYKVGGLPWKLGDVREGVCYLGLVFKRFEQEKDQREACCAAQMFLDSGDGMVFRGISGKWYDPDTKQFHISEDAAYQMLERSLDAFLDESQGGEYPKQVFIHTRTNFSDEEWNGFLRAAHGKTSIIGVQIRNDSSLKVYRSKNYCIARGTSIILSGKEAYLFANGFIPRLQTQKGSEMPNPLHIKVIRGEENIRVVLRDVLALTKLNYNGCNHSDGVPVTLKFADAIGEILTAGIIPEVEVMPFKFYI